MFVKRIIEESWIGPKNRSTESACISIEQVEAAVRALNGRDRTLMCFEANGERSLTVGGGNDGRYVAFVTIGVDDEFFNLVIPIAAESSAELEVVTGGQTGLFPAKQCIGLEMVLVAARQFVIDGTMSRSLSWERQP